ncbi:hypothetical protein [Dyella sp.]|jgi:pimeloyl-ACP methyl ester carboxylesterase|uniref:hypothetical protein n=1 Tax=Dyella sp. TaxID=1869338 RepID=UPI002D77057E|nr:hypothetical protein [Dyella sp.]HET6431951.1 hypothetical protein [Dyella sp.]
MSGVSNGGAESREPPALAEPGFFGTDPDRPRFGWLHRPAAPMNGVGLVVVPPFGYEAICAQRSLRVLAVQAACAGLVAVRVDLDGTGNSMGDDLDADRLDAWLASIDDACALARGAGAERLVLVGVRLGVSLATLAARRRDDVAGLVAIAAVPRGKAWLREGRVLQMAMQLTPAPAAADATDDAQELAGFALTAQTREAIAAIDLLALDRAPAPAVLLLDRDDLPGNDTWATHLAALGCEVSQQRLPGYVEMMLDPHRIVVPQAIVDAAVGFAAARPALANVPRDRGPVLSLQRRIAWQGEGAALSEEVVRLDECLLALVTRPVAAPRSAVILLNAGAIGQVGPNRLHVVLARRLAAAGYLVMRLDISGIGDSPARPGAEENVVYSTHALDDIGLALAWVRRIVTGRVAVAGLCAGAYHALRVAIAGHAVETVLAINPLTFHYTPGMPLDFAGFRVAIEAKRYQKSMVSGASWRKVLRGDVDLVRVAKIVLHRARHAAARPLRDLARRLHWPLRDDLGTELAGLAQRGVALRFIFAADDPGQQLLLDEGGAVVRRLAASGHLRTRVIDGADHTFTARWTHPILLDAITEAIEH